jgi:Flp pilus assembly protein TadD
VLTRSILFRVGATAALIVVATALSTSTGCTFVRTRMDMKKGNESFNIQQFEVAVEAYKRVIAINPTYKDAYKNLGLAYLTLYQPGSTHEKDFAYANGAIEAFQDYLLLDSGNEDVRSYLIEMCQQSGNEEKAIRYFEEEYRRHTDDVQTISLIGNLHTRLGDIDTALEWMAKRVDLEPDNPEAYYTIGVNCWARSYNHMDLSTEARFEILDRGLAALDRAIELLPDYGDAFAYKNLIFRQKAAFAATGAERVQYTSLADEFQAKAVELLKAKKEAEALVAAQAQEEAGG